MYLKIIETRAPKSEVKFMNIIALGLLSLFTGLDNDASTSGS